MTIQAPITYQTNAAGVAVAIVANTETVVATLPACTPTFFRGFMVDAFLTIAPHAAADSLTLRIRRDGVAGAQVGSDWAYALAAPRAADQWGVHAWNDAENGADVVYVITAQQANAAGNGSCTDFVATARTSDAVTGGIA